MLKILKLTLQCDLKMIIFAAWLENWALGLNVKTES